MTPDREPQLPGTGEHRHSSRRQVGQQSREQLLEDLRAARQQRVRMPALRNPLPVCRAAPAAGRGRQPSPAGRHRPAPGPPAARPCWPQGPQRDHRSSASRPTPLIKPVPAGAVSPPAQVADRSSARPRTPVTAPWSQARPSSPDVLTEGPRTASDTRPGATPSVPAEDNYPQPGQAGAARPDAPCRRGLHRAKPTATAHSAAHRRIICARSFAWLTQLPATRIRQVSSSRLARGNHATRLSPTQVRRESRSFRAAAAVLARRCGLRAC